MKAQETCAAYRAALAAGEKAEAFVARLARSEGVQRPAIWRRLRSGGALPKYNSTPKKYPYKPKSEYKTHVERTMERVDRDPCPRCGVRGDIICGHSRAPLTVTL